MELKLSDCTLYQGVGSIYPRTGHAFTVPEHSGLELDVAIDDGGKVHEETLEMYYYTNWGVVSEPLIISALAGDIYVFMQHTDSSYNSLRYALMGGEAQPEDFILKVKRVPLIWLVWLGIVLQSIGMTLLLYSELRRKV
jgi:cytochrome c biogenesis factor